MPEATVFDHYEVLHREDGSLFELGRGSMGITYKAFDTNLRCMVALKVINGASIHSDLARERFVSEARAAAQLRHRNVASVFHLGVTGDTFFYAMEFIEGETVESLIRRGGPLQPVLAVRIAVQVARALNAAQAHQLVHRDIKPSNLMLVREDEELVVKVIDFGLAKSNRVEDAPEEARLSESGFVGTPHFASPEQLEEREIDVRSDIYSLGVTLWYMVTGEPPFGGALEQVISQHVHTPPPANRIAFLPEPLRDVVLRMLAKDPAQRPQTPVELRAQLEACIEGAAQATGADPSGDIVLAPETGRTGGAILKEKGFYAGAIVGGRYKLLRDLGESTSGWTFQAEDTQDGSKCRLLVLGAEWAGNSAALTEIEREAEELRSLAHPNILKVLSIERAGEASFILTEWIDGFSLLELLRCRQELNADETVLLVGQIAAGVDAAISRGLRHLDFSLNQILVHFPGNEKEAEGHTGNHIEAHVDRWPQFLIKVNALGITREFATSDTWAGGQTMVADLTAAAPDQADDPSRLCVKSLAGIVYELLGGAPFSAKLGSIGSHVATRYVPVAALPESGNQVVKRALDPHHSFATADEFCQALKASLTGGYSPLPSPSAPSAPSASGLLPPQGIPAQPAAAPPHPLPAAPSRSRWLGLAAISACAIAAVGLWAMNRSNSRPEPPASPALSSPAPTAELLAGNSPAPGISPATVTPSEAPGLPPPTPDPAALMKAKLREGEGFESAQNWPMAIESYVEFTGSFPGVDTGRIRLETLLSSLRPVLEKMPASQFAALQPAITDAAKQDVVSAMVILADQLRATAPADAFAWCCAAAARGNAPAMTEAGLMVSDGAGTAQNYALAVKWFQMAAAAGDAAGNTCLAECYLYGKGVAKDEVHAVNLLQTAVAGRDPRGMDLLGMCYHRGIGCTKDYAQAFKLFSGAYDLGFTYAAGNLGILYMNGDGVPRDPHKGVNLFAEGAQNGSPYCMYLLAKCLENGTGIVANQFKAEDWYRKAAAGGDPMAIQWCKEKNLPVQ